MLGNFHMYNYVLSLPTCWFLEGELIRVMQGGRVYPYDMSVASGLCAPVATDGVYIFALFGCYDRFGRYLVRRTRLGQLGTDPIWSCATFTFVDLSLCCLLVA